MRNMTDSEIRELIDAGFTADDIQQYLDMLSFAIVVAKAGETNDGFPLGRVRLGAEKAALLMRILGDMKDDTTG